MLRKIITIGISISIFTVSYFMASPASAYYELYEKKNNFVYCSDKKLESVDPATFIDFSDGGYGKDKNFVYYFCEKLDSADSETFKMLGTDDVWSGGNFTYGIDKNHVYLHGKIIDKADVDTFTLFHQVGDAAFASDKNHVFFQGKIIQDIDLESFDFVRFFDSDNTYADSYFSKDKNHVYLRDEKLKNLDPGSVIVIDDSAVYSRDPEIAYLKDKNGVYLFDEKLEHVDADTLIDLKLDYWKDKNHVYYGGLKEEHIVLSADPNTFQVLFQYADTDKNEIGQYHNNDAFGEDINNIYFENKIYKKNESGLAIFQDIKSSPYKKSIGELAKMGINLGAEDKLFYPYSSLKRGEFLKILILTKNQGKDPIDKYGECHSGLRDEGLRGKNNNYEDCLGFEKEITECFSDLENDQISRYVCYAKKEGFVEGYSDKTFQLERRNC